MRSPGSASSPTCPRPSSRRSSTSSTSGCSPSGETILHQGLSGSGFYVIVDGEAASSDRRRSNGRTSVAATSSARCRSFSACRRSPTSSRPARCAASSWPVPRSSRSSSSQPKVMFRMLQAQARRLRAANRWGAERLDPTVPARRDIRSSSSAPGRAVSRSRTRCGGTGIAPRGHRRGSGAGRDVPALAALPAAAVLDQAARAGAARLARVRALRLEQPPRRRARGARAPARAHGRHARTSRRGPRWRRTCGRFAERARHRGPLRLSLDGHASGRGRRGRADSS